MHKFTKENSIKTNAGDHYHPAQVPPGAENPSAVPLGNNTQSASNTQNDAKKQYDVWSLLRQAKKLADFNDRCRICQNVRLDHTPTPGIVEIRKGESGKHCFGNLLSCKNVWVCPLCAQRTARRRGEEVKRAMEMHREMGGYTYMATYTLQHRIYSTLLFILFGLRMAGRKFKSGRWYQGVKSNVVGTIGGLEVTWGKEFGFHPHLHEIVFTKRPMTDEEQSEWRERWRDKVESVGLYGGSRACHIVECFPSDYNCKFGADFEITGTLQKEGSGLSQWQILGLSEDPFYAALWKEYCKAFKGRRRLVWSKGLKVMFGIDDVDDDVEPSVTVATLSYEEFELIRKRGWERTFLLMLDELDFQAAYLWCFEMMEGEDFCILERSP